MELLIVRDKSRTVYVEKSLIKEVLIHPLIQAVPGAPAHIRGIMIYEGKPVVFRHIGDGDEYVCGIILNLRDGKLMGITGEPAGEEAGETDEMSEVMSEVTPGIWEK